jgi:dipeptidyl aminopeptidase/acylaminoacyl peptidase
LTDQVDLLGRIAYSRSNDESQWDIYASDASGDNETQITNTGNDDGYDEDPRYSPDGEEIAYHTRDSSGALVVWRVPYAGGTPTPFISEQNTYYLSGYVAWQKPDGQCVTYAGARQGALTQTDLKLWCPDADTTVLVSSDDLNESGSDWSPDGALIAYEADPVDREGSDEHWEIRVVDADGSNDRQFIHRIGTSERHPRWSPDGRSIAYVLFAGKEGRGAGTLVVKDLDTGVETYLVDNVGGPPSWSPDSTMIVFNCIRDSGPLPLGGRGPVVPEPVAGAENKGLYVLDLETGVVQRLRGYAGGAIATPGKYTWGFAPDWSAGTRTPTLPATETPTATRSPSATATQTLEPQPSRLIAFVPIAAKDFPADATSTATPPASVSPTSAAPTAEASPSPTSATPTPEASTTTAAP